VSIRDMEWRWWCGVVECGVVGEGGGGSRGQTGRWSMVLGGCGAKEWEMEMLASRERRKRHAVVIVDGWTVRRGFRGGGALPFFVLLVAARW